MRTMLFNEKENNLNVQLPLNYLYFYFISKSKPFDILYLEFKDTWMFLSHRQFILLIKKNIFWITEIKKKMCTRALSALKRMMKERNKRETKYY